MLVGGTYDFLWFVLGASVWDTREVPLASAVESRAFWVRGGTRTLAVVFAWFGSDLGLVLTSAFGCKVVPLDGLQKVSGFNFDGCSRTSGAS